MGAITDRLHKDSVMIDPRILSKNDLLARMADLLASQYLIEQPEQLLRDIMKREELGTTCLGFGCAVPHARTDAVDTTVMAAARLNPPMDLGAEDGEPVSLVFLMAGPMRSGSLHLKILSKLARLLHESSFRKELLEAETQKDFLDAIARRE